MVGSAIKHVFSLFFTRCNTSSMTAKIISWILRTALCIILLATNNGLAIVLCTHVLQEVFAIDSQTKWGERVQGQSFYTCRRESRFNVKGRTSDISPKHFFSSLAEVESSISRKCGEDMLKFLYYLAFHQYIVREEENHLKCTVNKVFMYSW